MSHFERTVFEGHETVGSGAGAFWESAQVNSILSKRINFSGVVPELDRDIKIKML